MEPNSQPQVIKQLFSYLIVENTQCTPGIPVKNDAKKPKI